MSVLCRGIDTLLQQCYATNRADTANYIKMHLDDKHTVHGTCRRALAHEASKASKAEAGASSKVRRLTRSMTGSFSFDVMCFLCGEAVAGCKDIRKVLSGDEFDNRIRNVIRERGNDEWAVEVQGRLDTIADLFSADAVYHLNCHARFKKKLPHTPLKVKLGRPQKKDAMCAFERLCDKLESECENEMYTLHQLHDMMSADDIDDVYSREYLKELLQNKYGNHIYFASRPGRDDVVGFSNFCDLVLHNKFFSDKNEGDGSEAERLVQKAAALIMAEIREFEYNREFYPTADDINGDGLKFLPPLLILLLKRLIRSPLKQAAIGQCIVHAARPQGSLMPLLFGVGVDSDQCDQQLHMKLARLGFSLSVDEIRRYKYSVLNTDQETGHNISEVVPVMHFVADNVDHNITTLDGLGTFHGMGIISATVLPPGGFGNMKRLVKRLKQPLRASEATHNKSVPILTCTNISDRQGVKDVKLKAMRSLQQPITIPAITNLNNLWHAAGIISQSNHPRPNWSGYMQSVCQGEHTGVSAVEMLSIIDLNPSDEDCILSTLVYVINQAKSFRIPTPNITFDQPLYIKAVDISMQANLDIVIRLGMVMRP